MATLPTTIYTMTMYVLKQSAKNTSIIVDTVSSLMFFADNQTVSRSKGLINLQSLIVVLPSFVNTGTHIFLHLYSKTSPLNQMRDISLIGRVISRRPIIVI
jgi:hypothetical protein